MKKLSKLVINPEKLMTDRELVTLKGGYGEGQYLVHVKCGFAPDYTSGCFPVYYDNWDLAAATITQICSPNGATYDSAACPE